MVLATKFKNTKFIFRVLAVILSIVMMAGSAFFAFRIAETGIYTHKLENILQGKSVSDNLSESREITSNLESDITYITNALYMKDEKAIEKALRAQKEKKLSEILTEFRKSKSEYDNTVKELQEENAEETDEEDGETVESTTAVNVDELDSDFGSETTFVYKDIDIYFNTSFWDDTQYRLFLYDTEETAKQKLDSMFESFLKKKMYFDHFEDGYRTESVLVGDDLKYYAKNTKNSFVLTNFEKNEKPESTLNNRYAITIKNSKAQYSPAFKDVLVNYTEKTTGEIGMCDKDIEYYLFVDENVDVNNGYLEEINNFFGVMEYSVAKDAAVAIILFVLSLICAIWYFINAGTKNKDGKVKRAFIDYLPTDVHLVLSGGAVTGLCALYIPLIEALDSSVAGVRNHIMFILLASAIAGAIWAMFIEFLSSLIRVCKSEKKLYKNLFVTILFKPVIWAFKKFKTLLTYTPENFKKRFTLFLVLYGVINLILFGIIIQGIFPIKASILMVLLNGAMMAFGTWYAVQLDRIITAAHNRTVPKVDYNKLPQSLKTLYNSLRYTQQELETAVAKAVRDERMRSELITNVSHDLKTPLTSIITYIDLLKTCDIDDKDAKDYLSVLDEKSNRLKRLIDDLIEASKITSGVITLNPVNISLTELAAQAVGEREREFEENSLKLVFDGSKKIGCFADGNKTFRILENLLSNAKKYSLKGTRVYCSVYETQNFSIFEIKNTSAQPLNITPAELTERFVRGDKSRTNEGNGLGLSIADNLCRAQGGHLNITIDGDLFKAQVMLPKAK